MISVIVPVYNEKPNIRPLLEEIATAAKTLPISEVVYVDDCSTDGTFEALGMLKPEFPFLRVLRHKENVGQSAALWTGVRAAGNDLIITMDGDGQNNPADIGLLYEAYQQKQGTHRKLAILGERAERQDNAMRRLSSYLANRIRGSLLKDQTKDTGCSLKMFRRQDYMNLPYFNHMHRFLPALMMRDGVHLVHILVSHRPRVHGVSKYGTLDRLFAGLFDLCGVMWLQSRSRRASGFYEKLT